MMGLIFSFIFGISRTIKNTTSIYIAKPRHQDPNIRFCTRCRFPKGLIKANEADLFVGPYCLRSTGLLKSVKTGC